uniref:DUF148 domain-containing protein n=1 Tax=Rhabditophanes sp. KR3021 TaxID=114890 RepID=A0AC35TVV3_9BILA
MCASFKIVLICVVLASVASAHGGGNRGSRQGNNRRGPPMPIFLKGLSGTEIREFLAIRRNDTLTKAEVTTSEDAWAAKQTPEILATYNEFKANMTTYNTNLKTKFDAAAQNLTAEAKAVYDQIETIRLNQDISYKQENTDIQKIMGETTQEIRQALMRLLVSCAFKGREGSNTNRLPNFNGNSFQQGGNINIQPIQAGSNMQFGSFKNRQ